LSGAEATIVGLVEAGTVEGYASQDTMDELTRVLKYPRFGLTDEEVEDAQSYYITTLLMVMPEVRGDIVEEDTEDNRVLECSLEARADFIVTGDKHLIKIREYKDVRILRASEFLEAFRSKPASQTEILPYNGGPGGFRTQLGASPNILIGSISILAELLTVHPNLRCACRF